MSISTDKNPYAHKGIDALVAHLDRSRPVVIQAHDFPDHDAVASGYALRQLLRLRDIPAELCYSGRIQSNSLTEAIRMLSIPLHNSSELNLTNQTQIILVDGFVGNRNVTDLPGEVVALIDHHSPPERPRVPIGIFAKTMDLPLRSFGVISIMLKFRCLMLVPQVC